MRRSHAASLLVLSLVPSLVFALASRTHAEDGRESLTGVTVQKDGKVLLVGETTSQGSLDIAVARLDRKGVLDPKFGNGGKVIVDLGGSDEGGAVAVDKKRRILVAGDSNADGGFDFVVLRLKKDGSLDPKFGTAGVTRIDMGGANDAAISIALDRKGRILLCGFVNPSADLQWGIVRLTKHGAGGKVFADFGAGADRGYSVAVDRKGRITVAGTTAAGDFTVARYDDSGTLDPDFGMAGIATADLGGIDNSFTVLLGKKRTVIATGLSSDGTSSYAAARFDRDGRLDPSFGGDGRVVLAVPGSARSAAVDKKGRAYLAGPSVGLTVVRLLKDGSPDPGFGTAGTFSSNPSNPSGTETCRRVALGKKGTVLVAGESSADGTVDMAVIQLDKKGVPVSKFNGGAIVRVDF